MLIGSGAVIQSERAGLALLAVAAFGLLGPYSLQRSVVNKEHAHAR